MRVQLIRDLAAPVAKPELHVLEATALYLNRSVRYRVPECVGRHVFMGALLAADRPGRDLGELGQPLHSPRHLFTRHAGRRARWE